MTEKELQEIEDSIAGFTLTPAIRDIRRLLAEVRRLRDALKGAAVITNQVHQNNKILIQAFENIVYHYPTIDTELDFEIAYDEVKKIAQSALDQVKGEGA